MIYKVTEENYKIIINKFPGIVFHKEKDGEFFVKLAVPGFFNQIKTYL